MQYPVGRTMDDSANNVELDETVGKVKTPEEKAVEETEKKEVEKTGAQISKARQDTARQAWEKQIQEVEKRNNGRRLAPEHRDKIEELIRRGELPPPISGGAGDSLFERFPSDEFEGRLRELGEELVGLGFRGGVPPERLNEMTEEVDVLVGLGRISDDEALRFKAEINEALISQREGRPYREERAGGTTEGRETRGQVAANNFYKEHLQLVEDLGTTGDDEGVINEIRARRGELLMPYRDKDKRTMAQALEGILTSPLSVEEKKEQLRTFIGESMGRYAEMVNNDEVHVEDRIESIQDLAKFIMRYGESDLYGLGKKYALLDRTFDERGHEVLKFNPENFLIWVRDQIIQLHDDNPASEMQPLSSVALESTFRTITIYSMNRFRGQYFFDEDTKEINNALADEAVNMCYLFGFFRNMDLAYKNAMGSDEKTPETLVGIHAKNDVTRGRNWADFFSMPGEYGKGVDENNPDSPTESRVGDAELIANDIYYNLSDLGELNDILRGEHALNTKEGFRRQLLISQGKLEWEEPDNEPGLYDKATDTFYTGSISNPIFDGDRINEKNYLKFINFFNEPTPILSRMNFVRGLVTMTAAKKAGLDDGYSKAPQEREQKRRRYEELLRQAGGDENKARTLWRQEFRWNRINATFAEYSAIIQQRPLMIAARNDTNRRGYDASTKLDIQNYFIRQSGERTAGPIGNPEALTHSIFKNVSVDFVAGLKTENERTPYEIFKEIRGIINSDLPEDEKQRRKAAALAQLRFRDNAAVDYSSNQISRAFQLFHRQGGAEELNLDKIITRDNVFGIRYNATEFEKQVKDDFIKPMRYAFSSNSALKYGSIYRGFERLDENDMPIYRDKALAEHMFGDEVMDSIRSEYEDKDYNAYLDYLNSDAGRSKLVKNSARALLAAELRKHRKLYGPAPRWNSDMVNRFISALESIHALRRDEATGQIVEDPSLRFFSPEDISWIRQNSGTGYKSMVAKETASSGGLGLMKGMFSGVKEFFDETFEG